MVKSGASKGAKKINPFNDGVLVGVNQGPSTPVKVYEDVDGYGKKSSIIQRVGLFIKDLNLF